MNNYNLENALNAIQNVKFKGNVTPHIWYKKITFENGKPDLHAILILSEILYWFRPNEIRDERTGEVLGYQKKFKADMLQRSTSSFATQFGMSQRQASDALKRLVDKGLIIKEQRQIKTQMGTLPNVLFIAPIIEKIIELQADIGLIEPEKNPEDEFGGGQDDYFVPISKSKPPISRLNPGGTATERRPSYVEMHHGLQSSDMPPAIQRMTYTEITTKNSTENTTKKTAAASVVVNSAPIAAKNLSLAAADFNFLKNEKSTAVPLANSNANTVQNQFQDAVIGTQLTQNQQRKIKNYVDENYEKSLSHLGEKDHLLQEVSAEILNPTSFIKTKGKFNHKLNAINCAIKKNQWQPESVLKLQQANQAEYEQKIKSLKNKIREFELDRDGAEQDVKKLEGHHALVQCRLNQIARCDEVLKPLLAELAVLEQQNSQKTTNMRLRL